MIDRVAAVSLFVNDQDKAIDFYVNKLGFELREDNIMNDDGARWIAVAPKGAETEVILYKPDKDWEHYRHVIGKSQALTFNVTDMQALVPDLKAKGVRFAEEPFPQPWGTFAMIMDADDNVVILVERPGEMPQMDGTGENVAQ